MGSIKININLLYLGLAFPAKIHQKLCFWLLKMRCTIILPTAYAYLQIFVYMIN